MLSLGGLQACSDAKVVERIDPTPIKIDFTYCLGEKASAEDGTCRATVDGAAAQETRANGCLVIETTDGSERVHLAFSWNGLNGDVHLLSDAVMPFGREATVRASAFILSTGYDPDLHVATCAEDGPYTIDGPCEGACVIKLSQSIFSLSDGADLRFTATDGTCGTAWNTAREVVERCDGLDNDCDGRADEAFPDLGSPCRAVLATCELPGVLACAPNGASANCTVDLPAETANDLDDDCDGLVDEGVLGACQPDVDERRPCNEGLQAPCVAGWQACLPSGMWGTCVLDDGVTPVTLPSVEVCGGEDEDCDGQVDEGFVDPSAGLAIGDPCTVGEGACERTGVLECRGPGQDAACSARPGAPEVETCNGIDDDCDGAIDQPLGEDALGPCYITELPNEAGICQAGNYACEAGALVCLDAVGPEDEICNDIDDDCDGGIDEGILNLCGECGPLPEEICNQLDDDCDGETDEELLARPESCGFCDNDCTALAPNTIFGCVDGTCVINRCEEGYQNDDGVLENGCECAPRLADFPDPELIDVNCDGIDGNIDRASSVFVSPDGNPNGLGSAADPVPTLGAAFALAADNLPAEIYLSEGEHDVTAGLSDGDAAAVRRVGLVVPPGVSLFGGFYRRGDQWDRRIRSAAGETVVTGSPVLLQYLGDADAKTVYVDNLRLTATDAPLQGDTPSVGYVFQGRAHSLMMRNVSIQAGMGASGLSALPPPRTAGGEEGGDGNRQVPGAGGLSPADCQGRDGGDGGSRQPGGDPGLPGQGENPGDGGDAATRGGQGGDGQPGERGAHGIPSGQVTDVFWLPRAGARGTPGTPGSGGGGGGGGRNNSGGGGGGGGCGGESGQAGGGGHGSFGLIVVASDVSLYETEISAAQGGAGGQGSAGGPGGNGGEGGDGAGDGGPGGRGGCGGAGGSGAGGPSYAVLRVWSGFNAGDECTVTFVDLDGNPLPEQEALAAAHFRFGMPGPGGTVAAGGECPAPDLESAPDGLVGTIGCCRLGPNRGSCVPDGEEPTLGCEGF